METLIRILREFPAIWLSFGLLISGLTSYYVARKFTPVYAEHVKEVTDMHKDMVAAYKIQIEELKTERSDYREKLHSEKGLHQATLLKLAEVESRPNVNQVYQGQQEFFSKMSGHMDEQTKTMQAIHESLKEHDQGIEARTAQVIKSVLEAVKDQANG